MIRTAVLGISFLMLAACSDVVDRRAATACLESFRGLQGFDETEWDLSSAASRLARNMDGTPRLHDGAQVYIIAIPRHGEEATFKGFEADDGTFVTLYGGDGTRSCSMFKDPSSGRWTNELEVRHDGRPSFRERVGG